MIPVYIGYDPKESIAYHVLAQSIMEKATAPVSITPVNLANLPEYQRERDPRQSTEFSMSRFLVPYLCNFTGHAIFMDCDMLLRDDIVKLWEARRFDTAVQVVKHDYTPKTKSKFLDQVQTKYPYKNWSSVMLFNCNHYHTRRLTPEYVNHASGLDLHQFKWCEENRIGELDKIWNHLVGEYDYDPNARIVHFTIGGPYFSEYFDVDYADEWYQTRARALRCDQLPMANAGVSIR